MRYDSSMYGDLPDFNQINAQAVYFPEQTEVPASGSQLVAQGTPGVPGAVTPAPMMARGVMGKPATWWLMLVVVLAIFIFVSRKFGGPEKFGNIKLTVWNGIFAVLFYVIILNFLKVVFSYVKVPGLSELVAAA